ncbi:hypothetical protein CIB84_016813, partial [Bambusicola thoracicus]
MGPCGALGRGLLGLGLLLGAVCGAAGELHTLRYIYTAMTDPGPGLPWFVIVGYVDGELFMQYNSTVQRVVPHTEWMAANMDQQYWDGQTQIAQGNEQVNRVDLVTLQRRYNQSGGSHTWQHMYGCNILKGGTSRGYHQDAYDGRDFIAFDKDTITYTAAVPEAVPTKRKWEEEGDAERMKNYLEETCVEWLQRYVKYGKAELDRRGEGGGWPWCGAGCGAGAQRGELSPALTAAHPQSGPRCECGG